MSHICFAVPAVMFCCSCRYALWSLASLVSPKACGAPPHRLLMYLSDPGFLLHHIASFIFCGLLEHTQTTKKKGDFSRSFHASCLQAITDCEIAHCVLARNIPWASLCAIPAAVLARPPCVGMLTRVAASHARRVVHYCTADTPNCRHGHSPTSETPAIVSGFSIDPAPMAFTYLTVIGKHLTLIELASIVMHLSYHCCGARIQGPWRDVGGVA